MYTYYLCDDNETILRLNLKIREEDKSYYLSLLENYLSELVFVEENEKKELVEKNQVAKKSKDKISIENCQIFLEKQMVTNTEEIEDYLPSVVTIKTKRYFFLRFFTIYVLIKLLSKELENVNTPYIKEISELLRTDYLDISLIYNIFWEAGSVSAKRSYDYDSLIKILKSLEIETTNKYSKWDLINYWQGDEAERETAESIANDSTSNKEALVRLNLSLSKTK